MMELNYLAILVAAVLGMVIGMIWYAPSVFGKAWSRMTGINMDKAEMKPKHMLAGFVAQLVMAYVLAPFIIGWHQSEVAMYGADAMSGLSVGLQTGFWLWLGIVATVMLGSVLWERKPFKLYMLNSGYWLVVLLVMGALLGYWQ